MLAAVLGAALTAGALAVVQPPASRARGTCPHARAHRHPRVNIPVSLMTAPRTSTIIRPTADQACTAALVAFERLRATTDADDARRAPLADRVLATCGD